MDKTVMHRFLGISLIVLGVGYFILLSPDTDAVREWFSERGVGSGAIIVILILILAVAWTILALSVKHIRKIKGKFIRGRELISFRQAEKRAALLRSEDDPGITFGFLQLPSVVATSHFAFIGTTGSGKTMSMRIMMQSVLRFIGKKADQRAIIFDAKQEILPILAGMNLGCEVITLSPFDERCAGWDMAADITSPATAQQVASILVPQTKGSAQPFFENAVRHILSGVMTSFIQHSPGKWRFLDVVLAMRSAETIQTIVRRSRETIDRLDLFSNPETAQNVMATVRTIMQQYEVVAARWARAKRSISLTEWLKSDSILVLGNDEALRAALDPINRVLFKRLAELVLAQSGSETRRTWIFLDELREAGKLEGLTSLLNKGRSNGACIVIGFQDIEGLRSVYTPEGAHEILSQCGNKALLRTDSSQTAEWAVKLVGEKEVLEEKQGRSNDTGGGIFGSSKGSRSLSYDIVKRPVVIQSELLSLPPTTPANGLSGFYIVPLVGAYQVQVKGSWLKERLAPIDTRIPGVVQCTGDDQFLEWWTDDDFCRLGLELLPIATYDAAAALSGVGIEPREIEF